MLLTHPVIFVVAEQRLADAAAGKVELAGDEATKLKASMLSGAQIAALSTMKQYTDFNDLAERDGFLVAYPDAVKFPLAKRNWNDGRQIMRYPAQRQRVDDTGFIAALIASFMP